MVKTKINHPPNHNFYGWYKPFSNGWTISALTTLISIQLNPPYSDCFTASPMRCFMRLWILWLIAPPGHCPSLPQRREWTELHQRYKKIKAFRKFRRVNKGECGKSSFNSTNNSTTGWWFEHSECLNWLFTSKISEIQLGQPKAPWKELLGGWGAQTPNCCSSIGFICVKYGWTINIIELRFV